MIERSELAAWLRLMVTPRLGRDVARRLLATFGSAEAASDASASALRQVLSPALATAFATPPEDFEGTVAAHWQWLQADVQRRHVVTLGDPHYPSALLETADPPLLLWVQGRPEALSQPALAIVGSRHPTPQGLENAQAFAAALTSAGLVVVSGLARGIDGAAHEGALSVGGTTIAVVGTGLDRVYPKEHFALAHRIAETGAIVSEYPLGTPPLGPYFLQRNRIIAGLTRGTLVVEAAQRSGSLTTARLASEAGREVFAIPGSIHSPQSKGCHQLIKQGGKLVESSQDILEELRWGPLASAAKSAASTPSSAGDANEDGTPPPAEAPLLVALGHDPVSLDALVARTGWSAAELSARLLELELIGRVARLPGQLYQRIDRG